MLLTSRVPVISCVGLIFSVCLGTGVEAVIGKHPQCTENQPIGQVLLGIDASGRRTSLIVVEAGQSTSTLTIPLEDWSSNTYPSLTGVSIELGYFHSMRRSIDRYFSTHTAAIRNLFNEFLSPDSRLPIYVEEPLRPVLEMQYLARELTGSEQNTLNQATQYLTRMDDELETTGIPITERSRIRLPEGIATHPNLQLMINVSMLLSRYERIQRRLMAAHRSVESNIAEGDARYSALNQTSIAPGVAIIPRMSLDLTRFNSCEILRQALEHTPEPLP